MRKIHFLPWETWVCFVHWTFITERSGTKFYELAASFYFHLKGTGEIILHVCYRCMGWHVEGVRLTPGSRVSCVWHLRFRTWFTVIVSVETGLSRAWGGDKNLAGMQNMAAYMEKNSTSDPSPFPGPSEGQGLPFFISYLCIDKRT